MPYTNNPRGNPRDALRLLVGDISTSTSGEFLSDVDMDFFISETSNRYVAAQLAANSLAATFAGSASAVSGSGYTEKQVGDLRLKKADLTQMAASYRQLSQKFGLMAAAGITPTAGGITASNGSTLAPFFFRRMLDNPSAVNPTTGSLST